MEKLWGTVDLVEGLIVEPEAFDPVCGPSELLLSAGNVRIIRCSSAHHLAGRQDQAIVRHLVLLTCKTGGETDRVRSQTIQGCEKSTFARIPEFPSQSLAASQLLKGNSHFSCNGNFNSKRLISLLDRLLEMSIAGVERAKFPLLSH
jgi:hypothetical protein